MAHDGAMFVVCNTDGFPVSEYDSRDDAIDACRELAVAAAAAGDTTNGYYIHNDATFEGHLASEFVDIMTAES